MMQQQLLDMTDIPPQIKSKLALVTKALEQFMLDPEALDEEEEEEIREMSHESEKQFSTIGDDEVVEEEAANERNFEIEHSTRETSYSFEDLVYEEEQEDEEDEGELVMEEECENDDDEDDYDGDESVMTEEKLKRMEERKMKNEKIQVLQKSWQKLCENQKTIHK